MTTSPAAASWASSPLAILLDLAHRARHADSLRELQFLLVNESHALAPYRQAALWLPAAGVAALSGVVQIESNVPYVQWLDSVCRAQVSTGADVTRIDATLLPPDLASDWADWLPAHGLWLPFAVPASKDDSPDRTERPKAGLLLARDTAWTDNEIALLTEWIDTWSHIWQTHYRAPNLGWRVWKARLAGAFRAPAGKPWWQTGAARVALGLLVVLCFPVRLTVLAPAELVPANPAVIRAPLEGVIDTFHVQPNEKVAKGQALFGFDEALIQAKRDVSRQALATVEAEYRQAAQQALTDPKSKAQLAILTGRIEEKRAETAFLAEQLGRARVLAPQEGIVLFDDPSEWIGKPVSVGERIMRIATPTDIEVEAWVPLSDAIPLPDKADVSLYLNASPLSPVDAEVRYFAHDAVERPDGSYAYRLRARLVAPTDHRVGLKGTARIQGHWVPLAYWVLRRPLASIRAYLGW